MNKNEQMNKRINEQMRKWTNEQKSTKINKWKMIIKKSGTQHNNL